MSNFAKLSYLSVFIGQLDMPLRPNLFCRMAKLSIWKNYEEKETCAKSNYESEWQNFENSHLEWQNFFKSANQNGRSAAVCPSEGQFYLRMADLKANERKQK